MAPPIPPATILKIKDLAARRAPSKEIARHLGLSVSLIHKVRQGQYDHRLARPLDDDAFPQMAVWCPRCRCHIYPPCQSCRLRAHQRRVGASKPRPQLAIYGASTEQQRKLDLSVAEIGLPLRVVNYLQQRGILTVLDLLSTTPEELLRIPNFAAKTLEMVYRCLARLGFTRTGGAAAPLRRAG